MLEEVVLGAKASDRVEMVAGLVEPALEPMFGRELMTGIGRSMEMPRGEDSHVAGTGSGGGGPQPEEDDRRSYEHSGKPTERGWRHAGAGSSSNTWDRAAGKHPPTGNSDGGSEGVKWNRSSENETRDESRGKTDMQSHQLRIDVDPGKSQEYVKPKPKDQGNFRTFGGNCDTLGDYVCCAS